MMSPTSLFRLMNQMFVGFGLALAFGAATGLAVWLTSPGTLKGYLDAYFVSFNCLISGGLIIGTAIFVFDSQKSIPSFIENAFDGAALRETSYQQQKTRYLSLRRS